MTTPGLRTEDADDPDAICMTPHEAAAFVYHENRLLDDLALEEWLELFTEDGIYWLPIVDGPLEDAAQSISLLYDDAARRSERVFRTLKTPVLDQNPRSRTIHFSSNIEVLPGNRSGETRVLCNTLVREIRVGGDRQIGLNEPQTFAGRCEYRLRRRGDSWGILLKKLHLLESEQPLQNLSFLL